MKTQVKTRAPVRVLLVDDHPLMRMTLTHAFAGDPRLEVVGEAGDGEDALAQAARLDPDVVVLDLVLPGMDGVEVARRLRADGPSSSVLVLTGRDDPHALLESLSAGAHGFLDKKADVKDVAATIVALAGGESRLTPEQETQALLELRKVAQQANERKTAGRVTDREMEVLRLITGGLTTTQMARRLGLTAKAIESRIGRLYRKLGVGTRAQAVARARHLGHLDPAPPSRVGV